MPYLSNGLAVLVVLFLPGFAWQAWTRPRSADPLQHLGEAAAISLALTALQGLLAFWVGAPLLAGNAWLFAGFWLVVGLAGWIRNRPDTRCSWRSAGGWLAAAAGFGLLAAFRLYQARGLIFPPWVDSVHHTLFVRMSLEAQGIPASMEPYLPVPFYYHYGFHLATALVSSLAQNPPQQAVLWFGQVLNAAVALAVYPLAKMILGSRSRALLAALLVGLGFQMPAYYLTWGRYSLLTGLVILPVALAAAWESAHLQPPSRFRWELALRLAILAAGTALAHYFALLLLIWFGAILLAALVLKKAWKTTRWALLTLLAGAGAGLLLALPWLGRALLLNTRNANLQMFPPVTASAPLLQVESLDYLRLLLGPWRNQVLLILAGIGLSASLRQPRLRPFLAWALLLGLFSLPWSAQVGLFRADYYTIILFLPASLLAAEVLVGGGESLNAFLAARSIKTRLPGWALSGFTAVLLLFWGFWETRSLVNPVTVFADSGDAAALAWVQEHTPLDARFLINSTPWLGSISRGVDGGYWLTPVTGRSTLPPSAAYGWGAKEYVRQVEGWISRAQALKGCSPEFWALAEEAGFTHIYLKRGVGGLAPESFMGCTGLETIYDQDGVVILKVR
ncbi:MAG TPA: DUF6541 family protein [Anaerolineaceae bacterium]